MGGKGSGSASDNHRGGRSKKTAVAVTGRGVPLMPPHMDKKAKPYWDYLTDILSQVACYEDSDAIAEMASVMMIRKQLFDEVLADPTENPLINKLFKALRMMNEYRVKFGMTPRDRNLLLTAGDEEEADELDEILKGR